MPRILKRVLFIVLPLAVLGAGWFLWKGRQAEAAPSWRLVEISRGDVTATVGATGTLSAIRTVEVGTQVSGQIVELKADFNDHVRRGELIARLDATLLEQAKLQAEAELSRAESDLDYRRYLLEQAQTLSASQNLSESDLRAAQLAVAQGEAARASAAAGLDRARRNLAYAEITAPISGVIIDRTVDVGQTVAASLAAPKLFLIAESLDRMQILASVDESDIGKVHVEQPVEFTVQAWTDRAFTGRVRQIRMQPQSSENVVNYTVVVEVDNPGGALMPGMTATLDFIVDRARAVLLVPNAALRFRPSEEMLAELKQERAARQEKTAGKDSSALKPGGQGRGMRGGARTGGGDFHGPGALTGPSRGNRGGTGAGPALLWILQDGKPRPLHVMKGMSDGTNTEVSGEGLQEGRQVIAGMTTGGSTKSSSPFQPQAQQSGPPRGGF